MQWFTTSLAAQGAMLAVVLLVLPAGKRLANQLLAMLVLTFSARLLASRPLEIGPSLLLLHNTAFLLGPLLLLYTQALTSPAFRLRPTHGWHALPTVLAVLLNLTVLVDYGRALEDPALVRISALHGMAANFSFVVYGVLIQYQLAWHRRELPVALEKAGLQWLQILTGLLLGAASAGLLANALRWFGYWAFNPAILIVLPVSILLFYLVAIVGFRHTRLLLGLEVLPSADQHEALEEAREAAEQRAEEGAAGRRYQRSGLDRDYLQKLWERVEQVVADEQLWLDSQLSLRCLAERLDVAPQALSEAFNVHAEVRFYDYINRLRVIEAQRLLRDPAHRNDTVLDVAMAAGFSSKSTFNKHFRQHTGLTPTAWRRR